MLRATTGLPYSTVEALPRSAAVFFNVTLLAVVTIWCAEISHGRITGTRIYSKSTYEIFYSMLLCNKYSGVSDFPTATRIFEVYDQLNKMKLFFFRPFNGT